MSATSPLRLAHSLAAFVARLETTYNASQESDNGGYVDAVSSVHDLPLEVRCEQHVVIVFNAQSPRIEATATIGEDGTLRDVKMIAKDHVINLTTDVEKGTSLYLAIQAYTEAFTI